MRTPGSTPTQPLAPHPSPPRRPPPFPPPPPPPTPPPPLPPPQPPLGAWSTQRRRAEPRRWCRTTPPSCQKGPPPSRRMPERRSRSNPSSLSFMVVAQKKGPPTDGAAQDSHARSQLDPNFADK